MVKESHQSGLSGPRCHLMDDGGRRCRRWPAEDDEYRNKFE
jgi:hypothetical protein